MIRRIPSLTLLTTLLALVPAAAGAQARAWSPAPAAPDAPEPPSPVLATAPRAIAMGARGFTLGGSETRFPQDPADSVYREARSLLNRGEWRRAATLFGQVANRQPASAYAADALYWQAFALYRIGGVTELRESLAALDARKSRFPRAGNGDEAESLATRVSGALAARGDSGAQARLRERATATAAGCDSEELSVRASALSTLMRNDPDAAMPIVMKVLDRRDECSVSLRKNAVMMIGSKGTPATKAKLVEVAKGDPNASVRSDAVGYLGRSSGDDVVTALEGVVRSDNTLSVQRAAVRALGQHGSPKAKAAIRALIERTDAPERLRVDAIRTFDWRGGPSFVCAGADCGYFGEAITLTGDRVEVIEARAAAMAARDEAREAARAEARAVERADRARGTAVAPVPAVPVTPPTPRVVVAPGFATTISSDWDMPQPTDRAISAEDAAWLRGVYPRLESVTLKSAAVGVLAGATDEPTRSWLLATMNREEEPAQVRNAILSRVGRDMPIAQLAKMYDGAATRGVRQEIIELFGRRKEPEATDKLIEIVRTGTDPQLRRAAISALNGKKDPRTTQLLLELIDR